MSGNRTTAGLAIVAALTLAGCAGQDGSSPVPPAPPAGILVTFEVNEGERFRVLLTDPADQAIAHQLLAGADGPDIPNGRIVRATGVNEGRGRSILATSSSPTSRPRSATGCRATSRAGR